MSWVVTRATVEGQIRMVEASYVAQPDEEPSALVALNVDAFSFDVWCDGTVADDELMIGLSRSREEAVAWRESAPGA